MKVKFRVWDAVKRQFSYPEEKKFRIRSDGNLEDGDARYIVQMWTGAKDAAGKDIYEGDYLSVEGYEEVLVVAWDFWWRGFSMKWNSGTDINWNDYKLTVVGNIFETK